jgi:hypothetical protein
VPRPAPQRATTLLPLIHKVAEEALKIIRPPELAPYTANPPPTTVTDTNPDVTTLLSAAELTLGASKLTAALMLPRCTPEDAKTT